MKRIVLLLGIAVTMFAQFGMWRGSGADDAPRTQPTLSEIMQQKMLHSQDVLQGLIDADFEQIQSAADSLLSKGIQESIQNVKERTDDETYEHFRLEYVRLSSQLISCAHDKNLPGATLYYQSLIQTCIACHQHLRLDSPKTVQSSRPERSPSMRRFAQAN